MFTLLKFKITNFLRALPFAKLILVRSCQDYSLINNIVTCKQKLRSLTGVRSDAQSWNSTFDSSTFFVFVLRLSYYCLRAKKTLIIEHVTVPLANSQ